MNRLFLIALVLFAAIATAQNEAAAFGPKTQFRFVVLDVGQGESERTAALQRLAYEVRKRTSIDAAEDVGTVKLDPQKLFEAPFLVLPVCRGLPPLTDMQVQLLRRYLDVGGFLFVDNCQGRPGGAADEWIHKELGRVYPERAFKPVPQDHSVTRSFYLIDRAYGRTNDRADFESIDDGDRTLILVNPNDMLGALMRDPFGNPIYDISERQREMAQRQGVNIALYALTLNYKKDQIHIPFILKRRQR
jgi:hypothetical protein